MHILLGTVPRQFHSHVESCPIDKCIRWSTHRNVTRVDIIRRIVVICLKDNSTVIICIIHSRKVTQWWVRKRLALMARKVVEHYTLC